MKLLRSVTYFCLVAVLLLHDVQGAGNIVRARLESCPGCKLNRLAGVKAFVYEDLPNYENTEFKKIQGASPVLFFLDESDEILEQHSIENFTRQECNDLLVAKGFKRKANKEL